MDGTQQPRRHSTYFSRSKAHLQSLTRTQNLTQITSRCRQTVRHQPAIAKTLQRIKAVQAHRQVSTHSLNPQSPPKRKRRSGRKSSIEDIEPDSARATYLEKNRKAASKCRSKQKQQQDDLIEQAREIENKNKCLKAEVSMLQGGMRELMDMVGQHNACSDTRLKQYLQRQADRLAAGSSRTPPLLDAQELFPTGHYL